VTALDIEDGRVVAIYAMRDPDKLRHLHEAVWPRGGYSTGLTGGGACPDAADRQWSSFKHSMLAIRK
jgi:hypothetical protein